jgi:predicted alpha/beta superfamily hydrolase
MTKPTFILHSPETGTDYWIHVNAPKTHGPWPAVLAMDGDFIASSRVNLRPALRATPLLFVAVGYGAGFGDTANRRGRDYTPVKHSDEPSSGGADAFLNFLTDTLWPELANRYPIDPARLGIAGHSFGSLLVLHALFQPKPFFTHYLASAPSIWWADRAILGQAAALRARQPSLPGRLFLSTGEKDSESMTGDLRLLEQQLAAKPFAGLEVISRRFPNKGHYNVVPVAFETGLREMFGSGKR